MELVKIDKKEFRRFVKEQRADNFLQSVEIYRRYQKQGKEAYLLGVRKDGEKLVAALLIVVAREVLGKKVFRAAGGPILDYEAEGAEEIVRFLTKEVRNSLRQKNGLVLQINPNLMAVARNSKNQIVDGEDNRAWRGKLEKMGWKYLGEYEQVKWEYVLDLPDLKAEMARLAKVGKARMAKRARKGKSVRSVKPEELGQQVVEGIMMGFRADHRQRIRRAQREGVRVREIQPDEMGILKELASEAAERHGFQDPGVKYYKEMRAAFGKKVKFMVAEMEVEGGNFRGEAAADSEHAISGFEAGVVPLAAAMFVLYGPEVVYLYSGSSRRWQKWGGSHALQWKMIQEALEGGFRRYNFYGVRPVEGDGVYEFKKGFHGRVEELLGTFMLPIAPVLGRIYQARIKPREMGEVQ